MKELILHVDHIKYESKSKTKLAEEGRKLHETDQMENALFVAIAVEKEDENNLKQIVGKAVDDLVKVSEEVKTKSIMLYPYVHLLFGSKPASPHFAVSLLKEMETELKHKKFTVKRAPFGFYKGFDLKVKGHPLSELSREFSVEGGKTAEKELDDEEIKSLLKQISRSRLDTSKLKDNDHRIIGQKLDLWSFNEVAPGMVFWHNKGLLLKNLLIDYWREVHRREGYEEISTPQIMDKKLWLLSGHWAKFKENLFVTGYEKRDFVVKPMNCPGGMLVYKTSSKSYKDLPLRVGELGVVHRQELSGVLAGLFRVIQFTQDDAHIFCTEEQMEDEISRIIDIIKEMFATFDLDFAHIELSTRPEKRIGSDQIWDLAEKSLEDVLKKKKMKYKVNEGDGAFYGPKIDFHLKDSLGRTWQCSTIQLDMAMPERFDLEYIDNKGEAKRPIMLHRVVYGAIERFIGIMTEHLNGKFPLWLNPVQVKVLTISDDHIPFASKVVEQLKTAGLRVELDDRTETMGKKIREAQISKINYMITIGDKEVEKQKLAVRSRDGEVKFGVAVDKFIEELLKEVKERKLK
ncbi:MAG: threonine--tRNA ligase [Candidatus Woesearchaeota archaeon]